jgi:hypothetical protein
MSRYVGIAELQQEMENESRSSDRRNMRRREQKGELKHTHRWRTCWWTATGI